MRSPPEIVGALAKFAVGVALAFVTASATASAQEVSPAPALPGACPSKPIAPVDAHTLFSCFYRASIRASHAARHQVVFETLTNANPETASSFLDAVNVTSEAFVDIAGRSGGKSVLDRITEVSFVVGEQPSANLADGVLTITIVPSSGSAGRPSTGQIERAAIRPAAPESP
jgi:hypothetical protein